MKKLLLIVNPVSGKMKAKSELLTVVTNLQNNGYFVTVKLTEYRGHAKEFAENAAKDGFDAVACFGGDGTLNETICGLMSSEAKLPLGYIPAGSTNDFAKSMKLSSNPAIAAKVVATGGLAKMIDSKGEIFDVCNPFLNLEGLRILYERNA